MATPEALAAIRAAKNVRRWGAWATTRFLEKRNVPWRLYLAALSFEARRCSSCTVPAVLLMRHADAGYPEAIACAKGQGVKLPMV